MEIEPLLALLERQAIVGALTLALLGLLLQVLLACKVSLVSAWTEARIKTNSDAILNNSAPKEYKDRLNARDLTTTLRSYVSLSWPKRSRKAAL